MRNFLPLIIFTALAFTNTSFAGAWAQPQGHYYTKLTFIYSKADGLYGINFPAMFNDFAVYFYGEYGVINRGTLILNFPTIKRSINEANFVRGKTTGFFAGDFEIQGKYQFLDRPIVASVLFGSKIPAVYQVEDFPPFGNGETDFDTKLPLGASLYPVPAYLTGDIGYRFRGGMFEDEIQFNFEAGYTFFRKYLLRFLGTGIQSVKDNAGQSDLLGFPLSQDQIRLGGGILYKLNENLEFDITYLKTTSGNYIPKANELFIGIAFKG